MIRRPPRSTLDRSSAASDVYKRQAVVGEERFEPLDGFDVEMVGGLVEQQHVGLGHELSLIHISEPTRPY